MAGAQALSFRYTLLSSFLTSLCCILSSFQVLGGQMNSSPCKHKQSFSQSHQVLARVSRGPVGKSYGIHPSRCSLQGMEGRQKDPACDELLGSNFQLSGARFLLPQARWPSFISILQTEKLLRIDRECIEKQWENAESIMIVDLNLSLSLSTVC